LVLAYGPWIKDDDDVDYECGAVGGMSIRGK
jgi:hypothetical protein